MKSSAGGTEAIFLKLYTTMVQPVGQPIRPSVTLVYLDPHPFRWKLEAQPTRFYEKQRTPTTGATAVAVAADALR